jgi:hypothetical protein
MFPLYRYAEPGRQTCDGAGAGPRANVSCRLQTFAPRAGACHWAPMPVFPLTGHVSVHKAASHR